VENAGLLFVGRVFGGLLGYVSHTPSPIVVNPSFLFLFFSSDPRPSIKKAASLALFFPGLTRGMAELLSSFFLSQRIACVLHTTAFCEGLCRPSPSSNDEVGYGSSSFFFFFARKERKALFSPTGPKPN